MRERVGAADGQLDPQRQVGLRTLDEPRGEVGAEQVKQVAAPLCQRSTKGGEPCGVDSS